MAFRRIAGWIWFLGPSLRGAKRRSNPGQPSRCPGLLRRFAPRNDGKNVSGGLPRLDAERLAAAAARLLVGIVEHEAALQLVLLIVHLGADQEHHRGRVDEDRHALV